MNSLLNLDKVNKIVGKGANERLYLFKKFLINNGQIPLYFSGPSGSGKTIMAQNLAKWYSEEFDVPAYYVQLSPDQTKTSVILGLRLVNGSMKPVSGVVANCMEEGGICVIDEATHGTQELLLMFNSICDRTCNTSIGDKSVDAKDTTRFILCSNDSDYAGNNKLPQSFAQRLIGFRFGYPTERDEVVIARKMIKDDINENNISLATIKYVTNIIREIRTNTYPLSVRNVANAVLMMNLYYDKSNEDKVITFGPNSSYNEAMLKNVFRRIYGRELFNLDDAINKKEILEIFEDVCCVGLNNYKESILSSCMYYLDIEGYGIDIKSIKDKLKSCLM
jgi:hypothetical protein